MLKYINRALALLLILLLINCEKNEGEFPADLAFSFEPSEARTTDSLRFQIDANSGIQKKRDIFYRWDWNGDSIWDTDFTSLASMSKRFLESGVYNVIMQYADGKGNTRSFSREISVAQGYSAPKPDFIVSPGTGNFTKEFVFDASSTKDYEDSLDQLLFRWDFHGDGFWDTSFDTVKVIRKKFEKAGFFNPKLEVKDPSKLVASISKELFVNRVDTLIDVNITWFPEDLAVGDTVIFDVSSSQHRLDPDLDFRTSWYMPNNPVWTDPGYEKQKKYRFGNEGLNRVGCKIIMDYSKLENIKYIEIFVSEENLPPEPSFDVSISNGNIHTQFYFDCWGSRDDHLATSKIFLRWDWDNDRIWDTPYSQDKEYFHQFTEPGNYTVALQAMDNFQVTKTIYGQITVSSFENPTGYFKDGRDGQLYGTVQLGSQWWMAENLRYEIPWKSKSGLETSVCLFERADWCESVGKLYHISSVISDRFDDKEDEVCPKGWHIPSKEEFEELFEILGGQGNAKDLVIGGSTDFNGQYLGYGSYYFVNAGMTVIDTAYNFNETFESMCFMSSSIAPDINDARTDSYAIKVSRNNGDLWQGYLPTRYYMPIRCLKDD